MSDETLQTDPETELLGSIAFVGTALSTFFLEDPEYGNGASVIGAYATIDVDSAAQAWPFVDDDTARSALSKIWLSCNKLECGAPVLPVSGEFRRLFTQAGGAAALPFGSVYTDERCCIFGRSTIELRSWFDDHGVPNRADEDTPDDHLGHLLATLPHLTQYKPELVGEFLKLHVLTWSSHYLDILASESKQPLYAGLAALTKASLEGIQRELGLDVTYPEYYK